MCVLVGAIKRAHLQQRHLSDCEHGGGRTPLRLAHVVGTNGAAGAHRLASAALQSQPGYLSSTAGFNSFTGCLEHSRCHMES